MGDQPKPATDAIVDALRQWAEDKDSMPDNVTRRDVLELILRIDQERQRADTERAISDAAKILHASYDARIAELERERDEARATCDGLRDDMVRCVRQHAEKAAEVRRAALLRAAEVVEAAFMAEEWPE